MPRKILKKFCERCGRTFLTYEENLIYCNTDCEGKHKYEKQRSIKSPSKTPYSCAFCGDEIRKGRKNSNCFCNHHCRKGYKKRLRDAQPKKESKKSPAKPLSHDTLNKIHEKRRVYDDKHAYWYVRRGGSY